MQVLEQWGFARVLALTVEKIEGKEHPAMSGLVDGRAQGIEIGQELDRRGQRAPFSNSKSLARLSNDGPQSASYMA